MKKCFAIFALTICFALPLHAQDKTASADHPQVSRFPGATIKDYMVSNFAETRLPIKLLSALESSDPPADKISRVEGKITYINYVIPINSTPLEVERSYEQALNAKGFHTLFTCSSGECINLGGYVVNSGQVMHAGFGETNFDSANRYLVTERDGPHGAVYVMAYAMSGTTGRAGSPGPSGS